MSQGSSTAGTFRRGWRLFGQVRQWRRMCDDLALLRWSLTDACAATALLHYIDHI